MNFKINKVAKSLAAMSAITTFGLFTVACSDDSSSPTISLEEISSSSDISSSSNINSSSSEGTSSSSTESPSSSSSEEGKIEPVMPPESDNIVAATTIPEEKGKGVLVDDLEDGDNQSLLGEQFWYVYNDNDGGKDGDGASKIITPVNEDGYAIPRRSDNGTKYAWAVYYALDKGEYKYDPYVGWGIYLPEELDKSAFGGITYWYKGGAHEIHVETTDVTDYDVHLAKVKASRTWKKVEIRFKDLVQGGWGKEVPFNAEHIEKISFQAKGNTGLVDSVLIDNLYLQDTSEVTKDVADMTINDPVLPETKIGDITISNPLQAKAMKYLDKGINITNWLEENKKFDGKFKFNESDVKLMAENGIKALRFPIDLDLYATNRDDYVAGKAAALTFDDKNLFAVLDSFAKWTANHDMSFIIDYHEYDNSYNTTSAATAGYRTMMANVWKHVAAHYATNTRENLFFELLNEPDMSKGKVTSANWRLAAQEMIDSIRVVDKTHSIIFGDAQWYGIKQLCAGTPLKDNNVIYAIHTYEPFTFTHQGASWGDYATIKNIMFPYDKSKWSEFSADFGVTKSTPAYVKTNIKNYYKTGSKEYIMSLVYPAKEWAVKNNVPVIINEFGAYTPKSDAQSVLNYMTAMREISETLEIPLQHWGYTGGFALFEGGDGNHGTTLIEGMKEAFGL